MSGVHPGSGSSGADSLAALRDSSGKTAAGASGRAIGTSDLWQAAVDATPQSMAVLDRDGVILAVNSNWTAVSLAGGRQADDVGTNYLKVCADVPAGSAAAADAANAAAAVKSVLVGARTVATSEYELAGRTYQLLVRRCALPPAAAVVRHLDVTETRSLQRQVDASRSYLDAVTDSMGEGLFVLDPQGRVQMMNPAAEEMLGWSFAEAGGQVMHELTHYVTADGADYPRDECPMLEAYSEGRIVRVSDDTFFRRDGSALPVAYTASPLRSQDGPSGCVVVFLDATSLREEERRLQQQVEDLSWLRRVQEAVSQDRLRLYSQPIVRLSDGEQVQQELLLRIIEPDGTIAGPTDYLLAAERHGIVGSIDRWVIRRAIAYAAKGASVEVNVSAASLAVPSFVDEIADILRASGADPSRVVFELTETAVIADEAAARGFLTALRGLGARIALDDFGTGYGGFTYLKHLPVDYLKIDREFVGDLTHNDRSRHVVQAVVNLARGFGLQTVAEGVEDAHTRGLLARMGVDLAQGYYFGEPAPLTDPEGVEGPVDG